MSWNAKTDRRDAVTERGFDLEVAEHHVPGVYWASDSGANDRLVLLGHGGTTHKKVACIENVAHLLAKRGIATAAIDGPGNGERAQAALDVNDTGAFARAWKDGGGTEG